MLSSKYALVLLTFILSIAMACALRCWQCNSLHKPECNDPFKPDIFAMADCSQQDKAITLEKSGNICRKIIQKVNDEYRTIRGCGYIGEDGEDVSADTPLSGACVKRAGTFSVLVQYCSCNGMDGCNPANKVFVSYISAVIPIIFLVIGKLLYV